MKKHIRAAWFTTILVAFTAYISLDTFVLGRAFDTNATGMNLSMFDNLTPASTAATEQSLTGPSSTGASATEPPSAEPSGNPDQTDGSGGNVSVSIAEYERYGTKIYVADVRLTSAVYLRTAFANDTYGRNITAKTSAIAAANGAILAVNGDFYGAQEKGYVIRNGIVYRATAKGADVFCIYADGTAEVVGDREYTAEELVGRGVWQAFTFGPGLIENGTITVDADDEVGKAKASNPRTAVGLVDANHFLFVVSDGRTDESKGLSLYELAEFMKSMGAVTAYNLDGGGSSTMYYNGEVVNNPTSGGRIKEREVSDIVYIGYES